MSPSFFFVVFAFIVMGYFSKTGEGLKCYVCNSYQKPRCAESSVKNDTSLLEECPEKNNMTAKFCRKITQSVYYDGKDNPIVFRGCAYDEHSSLGCKDRTGTYKFKSSYCECNEDECNSASSPVFPVALLVVCYGLLQLLGKHS